jgi:hypothetical protein
MHVLLYNTVYVNLYSKVTDDWQGFISKGVHRNTGWVTEGIDLKFPFSFPVAELQYCFTRCFFVGNIVFFRHQVEKSCFYWRIFIMTNWFNDELSSEFLGNICFPVAISMRIVVFDKLTLGIYVFMTIFGQKNNVTNIFSSVKFLKYDLSLVFVIKKISVNTAMFKEVRVSKL